jgi:hypothetical protein
VPLISATVVSGLLALAFFNFQSQERICKDRLNSK